MRIALFSDTYHPQVNGLVTSIDSNVEELPAMGHELIIFAPWLKGTEPDERVRRLAGFVYSPQPEYTFVLPWGKDFSLRHFAREKIDLVHLHATWGAGLVGLLAAKLFRKPLILTYHTFWEHYMHYSPLHRLRIPLKQQLAFLRWVTRRFCNPCAVVLAPTQAIKEALHAYGVTAPIEVMPSGLSSDTFVTHEDTPRRIRQRYGVPDDAALICSGGRLGREKNFHLLLEAVARDELQQQNPWVILVGDGPERENLSDQATALGLGERVHFTGYVPRPEALDIFEAADLFAFPSVSETQGMVVLEALARGTTVVAADALGPGEMLAGETAGWLAKPGSVESLASCMYEALTRPDAREAKSSAGKALAETYAAHRINRRLSELYERVKTAS